MSRGRDGLGPKCPVTNYKDVRRMIQAAMEERGHG